MLPVDLLFVIKHRAQDHPRLVLALFHLQGIIWVKTVEILGDVGWFQLKLANCLHHVASAECQTATKNHCHAIKIFQSRSRFLTSLFHTLEGDAACTFLSETCHVAIGKWIKSKMHIRRSRYIWSMNRGSLKVRSARDCTVTEVSWTHANSKYIKIDSHFPSKHSPLLNRIEGLSRKVVNLERNVSSWVLTFASKVDGYSIRQRETSAIAMV